MGGEKLDRVEKMKSRSNSQRTGRGNDVPVSWQLREPKWSGVPKVAKR